MIYNLFSLRNYVHLYGIIISGHIRFNACKVIGLTDIPAEIREYSDLLVLESEIKLSEFLREMEKADGSEYEGMRGPAFDTGQV